MNKKKIFISVLTLSLVFFLFIIPRMYESRIRKEAPELLRLNGFEIVKEGEYHFLYGEVDYIVTKNDVVDTINVRLSHGSLTIQPN